MYPNSVRNLIENFKNLPGVGRRTAERLAFSMIHFDKEVLTNFSNAILEVRDKVGNCSICGNLTDSSLCFICSDSDRDFSTIFVVEKSKDIILFEKLGVYHGVYHVLNGLISPIDGIGPDDIAIDTLISRIENEEVKEVILALKPSIEGETTMQYISKLLSGSDIKVSRIANGVPIGTDMEYIDSLTLELAIDERKELN